MGMRSCRVWDTGMFFESKGDVTGVLQWWPGLWTWRDSPADGLSQWRLMMGVMSCIVLDIGVFLRVTGMLQGCYRGGQASKPCGTPRQMVHHSGALWWAWWAVEFEIQGCFLRVKGMLQGCYSGGQSSKPCKSPWWMVCHSGALIWPRWVVEFEIQGCFLHVKGDVAGVWQWWPGLQTWPDSPADSLSQWRPIMGVMGCRVGLPIQGCYKGVSCELRRCYRSVTLVARPPNLASHFIQWFIKKISFLKNIRGDKEYPGSFKGCYRKIQLSSSQTLTLCKKRTF